MDDPAGSRLFIVCGKSVESETLEVAFKPFGNVQNVKVIRDKGVAYVKYDKASSAALAMEALNGEVLNNGRGPKLKVLLAEPPTARGMSQVRPVPSDAELSTDPDNNPPRSRLFIVVPKTADANLIQEDLGKFKDLEYCKTDLISTKGVVFAKYTKASSALLAMESVITKGSLSGYKVKCMLAEPKTRRPRPEASADLYHSPQGVKLDYGMGGHVDHGLPLKLGGVSNGFNSLQSVSGLNNMNGMGNMSPLNSGLDGLGQQVNLGFMQGLGTIGSAATPGSSMGNLGPSSLGATSIGSGSSNLSSATTYSGLSTNFTALNAASLSPSTPSPVVSRLRLFVVVNKGVSEEMLARLFRRFPGMEYCDLKKDRATGKSKGYAYINYSTPDAAAMAIEQLNGMEFPPHSGHRIKVMYAELLGVRPGVRSTGLPHMSPAPSPVHTPLAGGSQFSSIPEVPSVQDTLASMGLQNGDAGLHDVSRAIGSPVPTQARAH